jgi:hypothetical protein
MKICMILGAGFSAPAGMLTVDGISEKFTSPNIEDEILHCQSGEWQWSEMACAADKVNGTLSSQHIPTAYLLKELVRVYLSIEQSPVLNYEDFFQWVYDITKNNSCQFKRLKKRVRACLNAISNDTAYALDTLPNDLIYSCILHLIDSCLITRERVEDLITLYKSYIDLFQNEDNEIDIYTLNHDLLLELFTQECKLNMSNGFSTTLSTLYQNSKHIPIFDNTFAGRIRLIKLHGSVDQYKYGYTENSNRHKGYDYFKTLDYYDKQLAQDIDAHGNAIQKFTPNITPQFVTGRNKHNLIQKDKMYSELYKRFEANLPLAEKLIIVGYSFADEHINSIIKNSKDSIPEIININPNDKFPYKHHNIREINPTTDEIIL